MKKTTLSLAIGLLLLNSHTPAFAEEDFETSIPPQDQNGEPLPLDESDPLPPPPTDGTDVPPDSNINDGEIPPGDDFPPPNDELLEGDDPSQPPPRLDDFNLSSDQFEFFDADDIENIDPNAFAAFEPDDFNRLPPEAISGFTPEQFAQIDKDTLGSFSEEQFNQLPPEALADMNPENIGGFDPELFGQFGPEHFQQFNAEQFEEADPRDVFKMLANSNPEKINPDDVRDLLPEGWTMSDNGLIELPEGEGFALPPLSKTEGLIPDVFFPDEIPDLSKGLGLGGQGEPIIDGLNDALVRANLPQFDINQDDNGIMQVTGSDEFDGVNLAFIPDFANMLQGDNNAEPGLSQDERGLYVLTTPDGQMIPIRPVPKDVEAVKNLLPFEGGQATLGDEGDVLLSIPEQNGQPSIYGAGIFNPLINPAPEGLNPGFHVPNDPSGLEPITIVYEDGTSQTMNPTVPSPDEFIEKAKGFEGVDNTQYNADGSIDLTYEGNPVRLNPTFIVKTESLPADTEKVEPSITLLEGGFLEYRIQQDGQIVVFKVKISPL